MVKKEYRERALEDLALGRPNPADLPAVKDQPAEARETREAGGVSPPEMGGSARAGGLVRTFVGQSTQEGF